jgi:uncharacterized protein YjbI with pentapeptide repeats
VDPLPDPRPPRLPAELEVQDRPELEDEAELREVEVRGDLGDRSAADVTIDTCRFVGATFTGSTLDGLQLRDAVFERCDLSGVVLDEAELTRVELRDCRMSGFTATRSHLRDAVFVDCRLDEASFRMSTAERVRFEDCDLRGADLYQAELPDTRFTGCDLTGVELSGANLRGARLHGSIVQDVKGGRSLAGVVIDPSQVVPVSLSLLGALEVEIDHGDVDGDASP